MDHRHFDSEKVGPYLPEGMSSVDVQTLIDSMVWHLSFDFGGGLKAGTT